MDNESKPWFAADAWFVPGRFAGLLGLLIFLAYPGVVLGWQTFVNRDFGLFNYPVAFYFRESFWRGELPLWNPLNNCGIPLLAQWGNLVLYPKSGWVVFSVCLLVTLGRIVRPKSPSGCAWKIFGSADIRVGFGVDWHEAVDQMFAPRSQGLGMSEKSSK